MSSGIKLQVHMLLLMTTLLFASTAKAEGGIQALAGAAGQIAQSAFGYASVVEQEKTALFQAQQQAYNSSYLTSIYTDLSKAGILAGLWSTKYTINGALASLQDTFDTKIALNKGLLDYAKYTADSAYSYGALTRQYQSYFMNKMFDAERQNLGLQSQLAMASIYANQAANGAITSQFINSAAGASGGTLAINGASSPYPGYYGSVYGARPAANNRLLRSATAKRTFTGGSALPATTLAAGSTRRTFATGRSLSLPVNRAPVPQGVPHNQFHAREESGHGRQSSGHGRPSSNSIYQ